MDGVGRWELLVHCILALANSESFALDKLTVLEPRQWPLPVRFVVLLYDRASDFVACGGGATGAVVSG